MRSNELTTRTGEVLPLVPLRDMVVFPHMMAPFVVGRDSSIRALEAALATPSKRLFLSAQKDPQLDEPQPGDIHDLGVVATVAQSLKLPNGHIKVMVEGVRRGRISGFEERAGFLAVAVEPVPARPVDVEELKEYMGKVLGLFEQYAKLSHHLAFEGLAASLKIDDPDRFANFNPLTETPVRGTHWDFGDGTTSTQRNPAHVYASPGTSSSSDETKLRSILTRSNGSRSPDRFTTTTGTSSMRS